MRLLPLLLIPFFSSPALAKRIGPGTQIEPVRIGSNSARVLVRNSGETRGKFTIGAYSLDGELVQSVITPKTFSLAPKRTRKVRFTKLPNQDLLLCATVEVSPTLDLRSCVLSQPQ